MGLREKDGARGPAIYAVRRLEDFAGRLVRLAFPSRRLLAQIVLEGLVAGLSCWTGIGASLSGHEDVRSLLRMVKRSNTDSVKP